MNHAHSHWVRVFRIPYKKQGHVLIRGTEVACDTVTSGLQQAGQVWRIDTANVVTVHVATPYFEQPKTEPEQEQVDALFAQCQALADQYVREHYPAQTLVADDPE